MEAAMLVILGGICSIVLAYFTARIETRTALHKDKKQRDLDVVIEQRYKYFLPFKFCGNELRGRISHILKRLKGKGKKHDNMVARFTQDFSEKGFEWFLSDDIGPRGGYFITSTVHMNCMLFYWLKRMQYEYPYIPLKIPYEANELLDEYNRLIANHDYLKDIKPECDIHTIIKHIKITLGGEGGIPYGMHDSFGDYMYSHAEKRVINYEDFCHQLEDSNSRKKFEPILLFWTDLLDKDTGGMNEKKEKKLTILIKLLKLVEEAEIREL